jgi:hypothetical protein
VSKLRFTDAEKWRDPWYQGLSLLHKALWQYLTDNCDNAGVWVVNQREAEFHLGERVDWGVALAVFTGRVEAISPTKWHLVKFISFQYPGGLSEKSAPHRQVKRLLAHHGISLEKEPTCSLHGLRSSPKDKDTDQDKDEDEDSNANSSLGPTSAEHDGVCAPYPPGDKRIYPKERPARVGLVEWLVHHPRCIIGKDRDLWQGLFDYAGHETMSEAYGKMPSDAKLWFSVFNDFIHANYEEEKPNGTQG